MENNAVNKIMNDLKDPNFYHLSKEDRIKVQFNLFHGQGKRKKKRKKKKK